MTYPDIDLVRGFSLVNRSLRIMLKRLAYLAIVGTALTAAPSTFAQTNGSIRSVTLSSGGLAEVVREAEVGEGGHISIQVPLDQVDDILKSAVVRDPSGSVESISLAGPTMLEETFRTLPFTADDLRSLPTLLGALQGTEATVSSNGKTLTGKVLGVETRNGENDGQQYLLSMLDSEGSISTINLGSDATVRIEDQDMRETVRTATEMAGRGKADEARDILIKLGSSERRDVAVSYVVAAPVWKTAYRLIVDDTGSARVQAWAVLENATGEDWKDVSITLSTGEPVTLRQRLHQRHWKERSEVAVNTDASPVPPRDQGEIARFGHMAAKAESRMAMDGVAASAPVAESFSIAAASNLGEVAEGDTSATYRLPGTHDVVKGDTLSLPIVDAEMPADMVSFYRAGNGSAHPVAAVRIRNASEASLPPGILTVYDAKTGYVGDARLPSVPAGEERLASFASDTKVTVIEESKPSRNIVRVSVADGIVRTTVRVRDTVDYRIDGAHDAARKVLVEHPRRDGWRFNSGAAVNGTATHHRMLAEVEAGGSTTITATLEFDQSEQFGLVEADPAMIEAWISAADDATAEKLKELAEARRQQIVATRQLQSIDDQLARLSTEQERVRQNIAAVPVNSNLHERYIGMLTDQEEEMAELSAQRDEASRKAVLQEEGVRDIIRTL